MNLVFCNYKTGYGVGQLFTRGTVLLGKNQSKRKEEMEVKEKVEEDKKNKERREDEEGVSQLVD